jgi:hypothetical protein
MGIGTVLREARMKSNHGQHQHGAPRHYRHLAMMAALSFISMYALMYAMVDRLDNVYNNFNQFYMAGLMTAPMVVIELFLMRSMFPDRRLNAAIVAACAIATVGFWFLIRGQAAIGDRQFLKSMIPHHAAAVLMCRKAPIGDADVERLCRQIVASQEGEIRLMKDKLAKLN